MHLSAARMIFILLQLVRLSASSAFSQKYAVCENHVFKPTPLGLGLVEGYDKLELQMSQPTLRAHMEVRRVHAFIQKRCAHSNLCLASAHAPLLSCHSSAFSVSSV